MHDAARSFRDLHHTPGVLLMPNPWDVGSAVILERLGFSALATTSSGMAFSLGVPDGSVSADAVLEHCHAIVSATSIPVSGDLEQGFGDSPEEVADTIARAAATGLAGCSIEDHTGRPEDPIYSPSLATERVVAAVEASSALDQDLVVTARCEHLLWTDRGLDATIARLQAYEQAGADVVFAPGLGSVSEITAVCAAVDVPVSVGLEMATAPAVEQLAEAGVSRISIGAVFVRHAYGAMIEAARGLIDRGALPDTPGPIDYDELEDFFREATVDAD